jgi:hypothetical protein
MTSSNLRTGCMTKSFITAGVMLWNIVLSFYGRKMQTIQSSAIILNTLLLRLTSKKMKPMPHADLALVCE